MLTPASNKTLHSVGAVVRGVAAGWEHSMCVTVDGRLYSWGSGYKDSRRGIVPPVLGLGNNEGKLSPERITSIEGIHISSITCGWDHCLALDSNGRLLSWGSGQNGKLGHGNEENISAPCYVASLEGVTVVKIGAGSEHSAAISDKGIVYTWGHGDGGRLGHGDNSQCLLPSPIVCVTMMNSTPLDMHCGDKFTILLVSCDGDASSDKKESKPGVGSSSRLLLSSSDEKALLETISKDNMCGEDAVFRQMERLSSSVNEQQPLLNNFLLSPLPNQARPATLLDPGGITRQQLGYYTLSLLARACSSQDAEREGDMRPFSIDCTTKTYAKLSELVEKLSEPFSECIGRLESVNVGRSLVEEPNLEDSIESVTSGVFAESSSPSHKDNRGNSDAHFIAGSAWAKSLSTDVMASYVPLHCLLSILNINLEALIRQHARSRKPNSFLDEGGSMSASLKEPKGGQGDVMAQLQKDAAVRADPSNDSLDEYDQRFDFTHSDDDSDDNSSSGNDGSGVGDNELDPDENGAGRYARSDTDLRDDMSVYADSPDRPIREADTSDPRPGGIGRSRVPNDPLQQQAAPVFDFRGESIGERVRSRGNSQPGSRRNSRTGLTDAGIGRPSLNLCIDQNNALEDSMENSMDESLLNSPRNGYDFNGPLSPGALSVSGDFEQHNYNFKDNADYDDSNNHGNNNNNLSGSNKNTPSRLDCGGADPPSMLDHLDMSDDGYGAMLHSFDKEDAVLGIASISAGRFTDRGGSFEASDSELDLSTENIDTSGYAAVEDNVDVQRAILSSMESQKEENTILKQALSDLYDPQLVMARLKDTLIDLALNSYGAMINEGGRRGPSADDSTALSAAASIWQRCQSALAQGFPAFYSELETSRIVSELMTSPENLLYIIPAMCNGLLTTPKEDLGNGFGDLISISETAKTPEQVTPDDFLRSISFIQNTLLTAKHTSSLVAQKLKFSDGLCRSYYIFFRNMLDDLMKKVMGAAAKSDEDFVVLSGKTYSFVQNLLGKITDCLCSDINTFFGEGGSFFCTEQAEERWIANSFSGLLLPYVANMFSEKPGQAQSPFSILYIPKCVQLLRALEHNKVLVGLQYADQASSSEKGSQRLNDWLSDSLKLMLATVKDGIYLLRTHLPSGYVQDMSSCLAEYAELFSVPGVVGGIAQSLQPTRGDSRLQITIDTYCNMQAVLPLLAPSYRPVYLLPVETMRTLYSSETKSATPLAREMEVLARNLILQRMPFLLNEKFLGNCGFSDKTIRSIVDVFACAKSYTESNEAIVALLVLLLQSNCTGLNSFTDDSNGIACQVKEMLPSIWMNSFVILMCVIEMREVGQEKYFTNLGHNNVESLHQVFFKKVAYLIHFLPLCKFPLFLEFCGDESNTTIDCMSSQISNLLRSCIQNQLEPYKFEVFASSRSRESRCDKLSVAYAYNQLISLLASDVLLDDLQRLIIYKEYRRQSTVITLGTICSIMQITKESQLLQHFFIDLLYNSYNVDNNLSCDISFAALLMDPRKANPQSSGVVISHSNFSQEIRSVLLILDEILSDQIDMIDLSGKSSHIQPSDLYKVFANLPCILSCLQFSLNYIYNFYVESDGERGLAASTFLGMKTISKALEKVLAVLNHCDSGSLANNMGLTALHNSFMRTVDHCFQQYVMLLGENFLKSPHVEDGIAAPAPLSSIQPSVLSLVSLLMRCGTVLSKQLVHSTAQFQDFIVKCKATGITFIHAGVKSVASTSPSIVSNVFTPHGDYTIGFWIKLSPSLLSYRNKIHILSRTLETGLLHYLLTSHPILPLFSQETSILFLL